MRSHALFPAAALLALAAVTGCKTAPNSDAVRNENRNLHGLVEEQQHHIDELTAAKVDLDRRVKELEAQVNRVESTEKVVEQAKGEISEYVRQMLERFRGDSDIEIERTDHGLRFVLREAVLFATGSSELTAEGRAALKRVADALRGGSQRISIEGHTDDVPVAKEETLKRFPRGNIELSVARALAVWEYLSKDGQIVESRLSVAGHGQYRPRVPNTSEINRLKNRRVEILVEDH